MSVNVGQTENFKINTSAKSYHIDILRMGYYQGNGARKIVAGLRPTATLPQSQPACQTNSTTGLIDCGNWALSATWTVPSSAVSGVYLAHLVRDDTGGSSLIPFVVRNDSSTSDMLFQTSDTSWQAYNTYGGNSLYQCTVACPPGNPGGYKGAYKVSYNRPWHSADDDNGNSWLMATEYPMIRFLERNGYDVSYVSGLDVATRGSLLLQHKVFLSVGHDEYWSGDQRANVEAARDHGVNLAFFSGNEVFWKTRWEPDSSNTPGRVLVAYKETHFDTPVDPQDPPTWTGTWTDPRFSPPADGGRPPNALTGQFFIVNSGTTDIQVPAKYSGLRLWRNTAAARLSAGQTLTLGAGLGTLGYEWDEDADNGARPAGLFQLSSTTSTTAETFVDYGTNVTSPRTATHHLTLYRAPSGALVFGAGTVQWSWGLDGATTGKPADVNMQQATVNLFADMHAQPFTLMSGLVAATASTDSTAPTSRITSPTSGTNIADGSAVTITGTASDAGGGVVAGVEVSTDGGLTWHPATGTTSWSYNWIAHGSPSTNILSRAVDDSGNLETPSSGASVTVACPCSIWGNNVTPGLADSGDTNAAELGVKFTSDTFGMITGIRFYKSAKNTGTHVGNLWTAAGQLLARATFTNETASGWQQVNFSQPVPVNANTAYIASYFAPVGHYSQDEEYMYGHPAPPPDGNDSLDSAPLHVPRTSPGMTSSFYSYSTSTTFPTSTYDAENYWVDPVFSPAPAPGQATNVTASAGYASAAVAWNAPSTGGPVTAYTLTPYIGSTAQPPTTVSGTPAPTSAVVGGLGNGTTYTFTVTATNPNGAGPESTASAPVTPSATAPLTINGGFENGLSAWNASGVVPPTASTAKPHSGTGAALLGELSGTEALGDSSLSQQVTLPAGTRPTLSFWYWPSTTDALCTTTCQWDWEEAQIRSTTGTVLASVFRGNSNAQAWTQVTYDLSAYAGQTVVLWFNVHLDGANPPDDTAIYLDDVSVTTGGQTGATVPGAPTNVSATAGNGAATVTWTAPPDGGSPITSYTVTPFIGTTAQQTTTITGNPPATTASVSGLTNGTTYTFAVTATNSVGAGPASAKSNAVTPTGPPGAPTNVSATAGNASASVTWSAPSNGGSPITSYTVTPYIGTTAQQTTTITGSPPVTNATVPNLANGTTYTFTVTAANAVGTGPESSKSNAVTPTAPTPPGAPTNVTATAGNATATVTWTTPANGGSPITAYTVTPYIGGTAQQPTTITGNPPANSATLTGLANGTTYTFTVSATNSVGTGPESAQSNAVTPTAPTVPGAPTGVTAAAGNASATVSWTAPATGGSSITSYTIIPYIGATPQATTTITGSPPATSGTVAGLTNGTAYTFTVTATNGVGTGPESAPSNTVTPTSVVIPAFVQQVTAHGSSKSSLSATLPAAITTGNRLVVEVGVWSSRNATAKSVTDAAGNTYTEVVHFVASDGTEQSIWTAPITVGGGTTPAVKATPTSTADVGIAVLEYSGLSAASGSAAVDRSVTNSGTTTTATTVSSGPTAAATADNEMAVGFYCDSGFHVSITTGTGFTRRSLVNNTNDMELLAEDRSVSSGATANASAGTGARVVWLMSTVLFKTA